MSLHTHLQAVRAAQAECTRRRAAAKDAWRALQGVTTTVATPQRLVVTGALAGFLAGLPLPGRKDSGARVGHRLLDLLMDVMSSNIRSEMAAGAALARAEEDRAATPSTSGAGTGP